MTGSGIAKGLNHAITQTRRARWMSERKAISLDRLTQAPSRARVFQTDWKSTPSWFGLTAYALT
jgi:hypothetical protein